MSESSCCFIFNLKKWAAEYEEPFFGLLTDSGGIGEKIPLPNVTFDRSSGGLKEVKNITLKNLL